MQGTMHVLDHTGDSKLIWNTGNQAEVDAAKELFNKLRDKKYLAYTVDDDGERGEVIRRFDPNAGRIIMAPQLVGG